MTKQLIYTDITKVLYMMKNHEIRFQILDVLGVWDYMEWIEIEDNTELLCKIIQWFLDDEELTQEELTELEGDANHKHCARVHPDDVAKFQPANGDVVLFENELHLHKGLGHSYEIKLEKGLYDKVILETMNNKPFTFNVEEEKISLFSRDGKAWFAPDEVRDAA